MAVLPSNVSQETMHRLNTSKNSRDWMLHDFILYKCAGKYTISQIRRKLRVSKTAYYRLVKKMIEL